MDVKTYEKKEQEALDLLDQAVKKMKEIAFVNPSASSDEDALGILVSKFSKWDGQGIFNIAYQAFEDSNFHSFNNKFEQLWGENAK